jgi:hypothetical protein
MGRRRKRILISAAAAVVGLLALQLTAFIRYPREVKIAFEGTPGQSVIASIDVDGTSREESLTLPAEFSFKACDVSFFAIPKQTPSKDHLIVRIYLDEKHILACRDNRGVRGKVSVPSILGLGSRNYGIGGLSSEEVASLR